jgi:hypothetical protein
LMNHAGMLSWRKVNDFSISDMIAAGRGRRRAADGDWAGSGPLGGGRPAWSR